ncbi:MAG: acyltransferase [Flavobacteriales bacterium]|nr:acyltransferase [Flavobacteriales bacterium]
MRLSRAERLVFRIIPNWILIRVLPRMRRFRFLKETASTQVPITFTMWYNQKVLGHSGNCYWPVHTSSTVINFENVYCGIETSPGYSPGNYIQAFGKIYIGDYTQIASNVGIITGNHDLYDNRKHVVKDVCIGKYCWIGMNSIILPGTSLGDYTIVAAGSVVTKSFTSGYCVIGGNPAKVLKELDKEQVVFHTSPYEYNGYIQSSQFENYRKTYLNV